MSYDDHPLLPDHAAALRIIDANFNRATEGLRVVEEYCRFALDDAHLTRCCKEVRHQLVKALIDAKLGDLAATRDTQGDVGTTILLESDAAGKTETGPETHRNSLVRIAAANSQRVKQALRAIEEYTKLLSADATRQIESIRYRWYTLEKVFLTTTESQQRLANARLYVLIDGASSECALVERVQALVEGRVHIVQLRDKQLDDRTLLARARLLRRILDESSAPSTPPLLIINDRPDIAILARANGVHVGQEELTVQDVRKVVGPEMLIGVSTHTIEQARQAVLDGASYIGCGPTFPSGTKHFNDFPGLDFLRQVAAEISLPAFAIGGITHENLPQVLAAGFGRIAVGGAIFHAPNIEAEATRLLGALSVNEAKS